jgi:uncharacterized protein (TIGR02246 family)
MTLPAPADCDRAFAECVNARDLDGLLRLYEPDARYVRHDGTVAIGLAAIRPVLERLTIVPTAIDIQILNVIAIEDLAIVYNRWTTRSVALDGRVHESTGEAVEIVRRQPDRRWLFAIDDPFGRTRRFV